MSTNVVMVHPHLFWNSRCKTRLSMAV